MAVIERKYKDRLFTFIFGSEEHKDWTLSLYNLVNGSHYNDPEQIRMYTTVKYYIWGCIMMSHSFYLMNSICMSSSPPGIQICRSGCCNISETFLRDISGNTN